MATSRVPEQVLVKSRRRAMALQDLQGQFSADRLQTLAMPRMLGDSKVSPNGPSPCIIALVGEDKTILPKSRSPRRHYWAPAMGARRCSRPLKCQKEKRCGQSTECTREA